MELFDHPYAPFLGQVLKPSRYLGREFGAIRKNWQEVEARVCLAFPDIYDIGMSHLGYRILYKILNDDPRILAERAYTPAHDMLELLHEKGLPIASLESVRPLSDFDVVGFSLQYELTFTNILLMMDRGGIALRSAERGEDAPLVVAGGPVATHAEPMAPFFDAILVGDGEEALKAMVLCWADGKRAGKSRAERLRSLAGIAGIYVPSLYRVGPEERAGFWVVLPPEDPGIPFPVERALLPDLNEYPFPDTFPVGGPEAIFDRMSIEVARGCTEGCRFCQAGMIYRPVRERDPEQVVSTVLSALEKSGQDEVSLTALSTADVSCISPLIRKLVERTAKERVSLSVASLRAYGLSEDLLDEIKKVRVSGLTFAPEAGTQRMRDVINKNVTEEQLLETAERVFSRGFDRMKLYFILGLPTETDEDVLGIAQVGQNAMRVGRRVGKRAQVTVSVSVHVPKPHTPFQWCKMDDLEEVQRKQRLLKDALRGARGVSLRMHDSKTSELEGILARGDRRLAQVIELAYRKGARFDSWDEHFREDLWRESFTELGIDPAPFLATIPVHARLPWSHIDVGLEDGFLLREYRKALSSRLSPPCGKAKGMFVHHTNVEDANSDSRKLVCYDCGIACDLGAMRETRVSFLERMGALSKPARPVEKDLIRLPLWEEPREEQGTLPAESSEETVPVWPLDHERPSQRTSLSPQKKAAPLRDHGRPDRGEKLKARVRLRFQKTGPMTLSGHLDLIRELPRVIRRAGVRTAYTEGFHPKPEMTFAPALSLGVPSLDEWVDLSLLDPPDLQVLLDRLSRATSEGLRFLEAYHLGDRDRSISQVIDEAQYLVGFAESELLQRATPASETPRAFLERTLAEFAARGEVTVRRNAKGIWRTVDVKRGILKVEPGDAADLVSFRESGIVGRIVPLRVSVRIDPSGTTRLSELVEGIFGEGAPQFLAVRTALLGREMSPRELGFHKKPEHSKNRPAASEQPVESLVPGEGGP